MGLLTGELPDFPWDALEPYKATARAHPDGLVDLSVGTPVDPTPDVVQKALAGVMKIAYLCADPGIPVLGNKGASVHVREFTDALVSLGHDVRIYSAAGVGAGAPDGALNSTQSPLTVLAPSEQVQRRARIAADRWAGWRGTSRG